MGLNPPCDITVDPHHAYDDDKDEDKELDNAQGAVEKNAPFPR